MLQERVHRKLCVAKESSQEAVCCRREFTGSCMLQERVQRKMCVAGESSQEAVCCRREFTGSCVLQERVHRRAYNIFQFSRFVLGSMYVGFSS
jgi:hypothetical protein